MNSIELLVAVENLHLINPLHISSYIPDYSVLVILIPLKKFHFDTIFKSWFLPFKITLHYITNKTTIKNDNNTTVYEAKIQAEYIQRKICSETNVLFLLLS